VRGLLGQGGAYGALARGLAGVARARDARYGAATARVGLLHPRPGVTASERARAAPASPGVAPRARPGNWFGNDPALAQVGQEPEPPPLGQRGQPEGTTLRSRAVETQ